MGWHRKQTPAASTGASLPVDQPAIEEQETNDAVVGACVTGRCFAGQRCQGNPVRWDRQGPRGRQGAKGAFTVGGRQPLETLKMRGAGTPTGAGGSSNAALISRQRNLVSTSRRSLESLDSPGRGG